MPRLPDHRSCDSMTTAISSNLLAKPSLPAGSKTHEQQPAAHTCWISFLTKDANSLENLIMPIGIQKTFKAHSFVFHKQGDTSDLKGGIRAWVAHCYTQPPPNLSPQTKLGPVWALQSWNLIFFLFFFLGLFSFFLFILFFNFTILYWFCHISKWIRHRYTCVPHPEASSLLPPHTIPLGHPIAPAPSIQYRWENGVEICIISYMKRIASPGLMHDTGTWFSIPGLRILV